MYVCSDAQVPFAHEAPPAANLLSAVHQLCPSILIGVSTVANAFTQEVVAAMADINPRPLIFPLSNPTSKAECSFEQAVRSLQLHSRPATPCYMLIAWPVSSVQPSKRRQHV